MNVGRPSKYPPKKGDRVSENVERWFFKRGQLAEGNWETVVDERRPGWEHTGIRVGVLKSGESLELSDTGIERIIVPLAGSFTVTYTENGEEHVQELEGRKSVFHGATDVIYLSSQVTASVSGEGRFAVATSPTTEVFPTKYVAKKDVSLELRGSGASSRQVHNFGTVGNLDAARFIVCEVVTPSENWSSYPPHKHDEDKPGHESRLEEIYCFESAPVNVAPEGVDEEEAFGMFSTYSSPAGDIDIDARVFTGDVALVPFGYHGPAVAAPGYDLYYLNVMAGPDEERVWNISDDPAHAWVRETWEGQAIDDRLPFDENH